MQSLVADTATFDRLAPKGTVETDTPTPRQRMPWRRKLAMLGIALLLGLGLLKGYEYWSAGRHYETTDDAFVDSHISQVSPQVSGVVKKVLVRDNEEVAAGQVLIEIDPRDYANRLAQAKTQLATSIGQRKQVEAQIDLQKATIDQAAANLKASESDDIQARQDQTRYNALSSNAVSRQTVDHANATAASSAAKVDANKYALAAAKAQLEVIQAQLEAAKATVAQSQTQVDNAELQLSYTTIKAPVAGRVTKRSAEVGNYLTPGSVILSVVPDDVWVTANFKETQLADMKAGQKVDIYVDAFPHDHFEGHVDSFQSGTGSAFSVIPTENATGNYVKITQRLPVKIMIDGDSVAARRLAPGMSVQPKVAVR